MERQRDGLLHRGQNQSRKPMVEIEALSSAEDVPDVKKCLRQILECAGMSALLKAVPPSRDRRTPN
jgi:hypothetical protein